MTSSDCLFYPTKVQRYSVYYDIKQRKATNPLTGEAGTTELLAISEMF